MCLIRNRLILPISNIDRIQSLKQVDVNGKNVLSLDHEAMREKLTLDMDNFKSGIYFLQVIGKVENKVIPISIIK